MIELKNVSTGYGEQNVLESATLSIPSGGMTALIGPNGSGKSTLLRAMSALLPARGEIFYDGIALCSLEREERARLVSFMPQQRDVPDILARTLVEHGRYPHLGFSKKPGAKDYAFVERAIELTNTGGLMHKRIATLSGGERQRVYLAMLLAQDCKYLLLDEPLTYLDINAQLEMLYLIRDLRRIGKTVVMAIHDLAQAFTFADRVCLLQNGIVRRFALPSDERWPTLTEAAFAVRVTPCPDDGGLFAYRLESPCHAALHQKEGSL